METSADIGNNEIAIQTLYCDFKGAFIAAHPDLKADAALKLAQAKWNGVKKNKDEVKHLIRVWKAKETERKSRLLSMWTRAANLKVSSTNQVLECSGGQSQEMKSQADDMASATAVEDNSDTQTPLTEAVCVVETKSKLQTLQASSRCSQRRTGLCQR